MTLRAFVGAEIFDGTTLHRGRALLLEGDLCAGLVAADAVPPGCPVRALDGGTILPGFVDLQVNGGGGILFNDETSVAGLQTIARAHRATGTGGFLPTLITDTPARTRDAVEAAVQAIAMGVPGILGLHLEGPHLSLARKGAHAPDLIRPMTRQDALFLCEAAGRLPNLMVTVAPEAVTPAQIAALSRAGVIVALGHSDCTMAQAVAAFEAGAVCVTHLFNAMSPLGSRAPGLVGAALRSAGVSAGLIADGIHVHPDSIAVALAAKTGPGAIFLVTDAMATAGSRIEGFLLNGRRVLRRDGRLTLEDGTLAGADLDLPRALRVMVGQVGLPRAQALAMATSAPARVLRADLGHGRLAPSAPAHAIWMDDALREVRAL